MAFGLKKKKEFWHYDFQIDGERYAGSTRLRERRDALAYCRDYHRRIILGEAKLLRDTPTLEATCKAWLERQAGVKSAKHLRAAGQFFRNHFIPAMGHLSLHQIDTAVVEEKRQAYAMTHSPASTDGWLRYLKMVFKWAQAQGYLKAIPWDLKPLNAERPIKAVVPAGRVDEFLAEARNHTPQIAAALGVMLLMGLRNGEVLAMSWRHLDLEAGTYLVTGTKGKRSRLVPIPEALRADLAVLTRIEGSPWVFPAEDAKKRHGETWLRKPIKAIGQVMGIEGLSAHKLRASWATNMLSVANPKDVQAAGGWAKAETMMDHYATPDTERLRDVMNKGVPSNLRGRIGKFRLVKKIG